MHIPRQGARTGAAPYSFCRLHCPLRDSGHIPGQHFHLSTRHLTGFLGHFYRILPSLTHFSPAQFRLVSTPWSSWSWSWSGARATPAVQVPAYTRPNTPVGHLKGGLRPWFPGQAPTKEARGLGSRVRLLRLFPPSDPPWPVYPLGDRSGWYLHSF